MSARPQVTITLGRSRQVVKRTGSMPNIKDTNYATSSGTKRSIKERLGSIVDDPISYDRQFKNKRQQTKDHRKKLSDDDMEEEKRYMPSRKVGRNDLRFKLIQKHILKNTSGSHEKYDFDLREKISRNSRGPLKFNHPQQVQESQSSGQSRKIVSTKSADDLCRMDTLRKSYSLTSANEQRRRTPDRHIVISRGMSPQNYINDAKRVPLLRSSDILRSTSLTTKKFTDVLRAEPSSAKTAPVYAETSRTVYGASPSCHPVQQTPLKYEDHHSVASLLHALGLGKYAILFQAEEVDMPALKQMGDCDLKALGLPMGPRKKILLALPHPQKQPPQKGN